MSSQSRIALELAESHWARETIEALSAEDRAALGMEYLDFGSAMLWLTKNQRDIWLYNRTLALGLRRPATQDDLDQIIAAAQARGVRQLVFGVHPESLPSNLGDWLVARGAKAGRMWLQVSRDALLPTSPATPGEVQEVGPDRIDLFTDLLFACYGFPSGLLSLFRKTVGQPGWHYYVTMQGGVATACASLHMHDGFGFFGYAATLEQHRRKGLQSALIRRRIEDANKAGAHCLLAQVVEGVPGSPNPSENNMKRAGFTTAYRRAHYTLAIE